MSTVEKSTNAAILLEFVLFIIRYSFFFRLSDAVSGVFVLRHQHHHKKWQFVLHSYCVCFVTNFCFLFCIYSLIFEYRYMSSWLFCTWFRQWMRFFFQKQSKHSYSILRTFCWIFAVKDKVNFHSICITHTLILSFHLHVPFQLVDF